MTVTDREELIYLLSEAAELEHSLCCCYLFAAFSLKRNPDEDLTPTEHEALVRWKHTISQVAVQEMLHLALANNLLTSLGAAPHMRRPNFPQRSKYYPPTLQMTLRPFDERTLDHFIFIERPEGMDFPDAPGFEPAPAPTAPAPVDGIEPGDVPFSSVAQLYRDIEERFKALSARDGEERVFIGPPRAQATTAYFPFKELAAVTDLASALKVIELIVEQGEGLRGDIENSHYARFLAIRGELDMLRAARPGFEPARPVMENPFVEPPPDSTGFNLIEEPSARMAGDLFNASYALMIEMLMRFFAHTEETQEELRELASTAVGIMKRVLDPLGSMLTLMPATAAGDAPRAGASFAFYRSIDYLPHRDAAWIVFAERLGELVKVSGDIAAADSRGLGLQRVHASLEELAGNVSRFSDAHDRRVRTHPAPAIPGPS